MAVIATAFGLGYSLWRGWKVRMLFRRLKSQGIVCYLQHPKTYRLSGHFTPLDVWYLLSSILTID